ncbi:MAG: GAF domain-containing protein [Candidatus Limnocylindria bacterium]
MPDRNLPAALEAIRAAARRSLLARRLLSGAEQALLQSIVNTTATLFDAEAASIALFEKDPDRLEFRVAAGPQGAGAIGLSVAPSQGIAGFVYSTGQALALSDVASDPRFDRRTAERTGYVPRSIAAVPLVDGQATIGVLQVLDKRSSPTFSLRDMELLAVFAGQAATAINVARVQRDTASLLRSALASVGDDLSPEAVDIVVSEATATLDTDPDDPLWRVVEHVAALRRLGDGERALVADILAVIAERAARSPRRR